MAPATMGVSLRLTTAMRHQPRSGDSDFAAINCGLHLKPLFFVSTIQIEFHVHNRLTVETRMS